MFHEGGYLGQPTALDEGYMTGVIVICGVLGMAGKVHRDGEVKIILGADLTRDVEILHARYVVQARQGR